MRDMADARALAAAESTAIVERHVSMPCSGTINLNVRTRGVMLGGGAVASLVRTGICMIPKFPLLFKNEVVRVVVHPIWSARCLGSQMVR